MRRAAWLMMTAQRRIALTHASNETTTLAEVFITKRDKVEQRVRRQFVNTPSVKGGSL